MKSSRWPRPGLGLLWLFALSSVAAGTGCRGLPSAEAAKTPTIEELRAAGYSWPPGEADEAAPPAVRQPGSTASSVNGNEMPESLSPGPSPRRQLTGLEPAPQGDCLAALERANVAFQTLEEKRGVDTPVVVDGPLGGVRYYTHASTPFILDCRLALALHRVGPSLTRHGVTRARFSGAYVYRMSKKGRLSNHAYGLAIDLHEFEAAGERFSVKRDFARGQRCDGETPSARLPLPNRVACELTAVGLFREMLTPDYDADHHDHFHLGLAPLAAPAPPPPVTAQR